MRALADTVVLVTGATDGLGRGVAQELAARGATVHLHGRDAAKLAATAAAITAATGSTRLHIHRADLASLAEVRDLADRVLAATDALHVLINNAGIGSGRPDLTTRQESADGHELRFAVNFLAGVLLELRLLDLLRRSAPARIVQVASLGQQAVDFDDVMLERDYGGGRAYSQSKLAQITAGLALAERVAADGITVTSLHPATYMPTKIVLEQAGHAIETLEEGVDATVRLAVGPELEGVTGQFYDRRRQGHADPQAYDPEARERLWALALALVGEDDVDRAGRTS